MGKMVLLLVAASLATSVIVVNGNGGHLRSAEGHVHEAATRALAVEIAHSGAAEAEGELLTELASTGVYSGKMSFNATYQGGRYEARITRDDTTYTVTSVGRFGDEEATVQRQFRPGDLPPPEFVRPAFVTNNTISATRPFQVDAEDPTWNPVVHANGTVDIRTSDFLTRGFVRYAGHISNTSGLPYSSLIQPYSNPDGEPLQALAAHVPFPAFTPSAHRAKATRVTLSNLTLSGNVTLGTRERPMIWYVGGVLRTSGPVTFSGYGIFVVEKMADLQHDVSSPPGKGGESTVAIYAGGSGIKIGGAAPVTVAAQMFTTGTLAVHTATRIVGTAAVGNTMSVMAPLHITLRHPTSVLTRPIWPTAPTTTTTRVLEWPATDGLRLVASRTW